MEALSHGPQAMTQLLEEVFAHVQRLPDTEQDAIADVIFEELEDEKRWQAAFASSQDQLAVLGMKALAEYRAGNTRELKLEDL
jgi:hypothetical protein